MSGRIACLLLDVWLTALLIFLYLARAVMKERGEEGQPVRPEHLLEAHRRYKQAREKPGYYPIGGTSGAPGAGKKRKLF